MRKTETNVEGIIWCLQNLIIELGSHKATGRAGREKVKEVHNLFTNSWPICGN